MQEFDNNPVDTVATLEHVRKALRAENQVKQLQMAMRIELRNLLTAEQVAYLRSVGP